MNREECWYKEVCNKQCSDSCIRYLEMLSLLEKSCLPKCRWFPSVLYPDDCDYNTYVELSAIKQNIEQVVKNGSNIYLFSDKTGNGKTTWAIKLMLKYFNDIWAGNGFRCRGLFIHVPTFLTQLKNFNVKDTEFERVKNDIANVDLVIWDDIASTDLSSYDNSQLLTYLDCRMLSMKSNIFTGNADNTAIVKMLGLRLASRVWNNSQHFELKGRDKRNEILSD